MIKRSELDPQAKNPLITEIDASDIQLSDEDTATTAGVYGFGKKYSGIFRGFEEMTSLHDFFELGNPEEWLNSTDSDERIEMRRKMEELKFSEEYYLQELIDTSAADFLLEFKPYWTKSTDNVVESLNALSLTENLFTDIECEKMTRLPSRRCKF